ncbi:unnamed protein product [Caenorhabditis bovis]|uniref:DOP1 N-terminal domain-containing protein n=1 Tax=Caenorhabditis bovis TaxID=2654633 RepID=A0A8S1F9I3_9PELO|nr:unnamed protein product [Caenorhabditis bovis]
MNSNDGPLKLRSRLARIGRCVRCSLRYAMPVGIHLRNSIDVRDLIKNTMLDFDFAITMPMNLLDRLRKRVGRTQFYRAFWQVVADFPDCHVAAMMYLYRAFDKTKTTAQQMYLFGDSLEFMMEGFIEVAQDYDNTKAIEYLQRFLVRAFPLDGPHLSEAQLLELVEHCIFFVLHSDGPLVTSFYTWILNSTDHSDLSFFYDRSCELILTAMNRFLNVNTLKGAIHPEYRYVDIADVKIYTEILLCRVLIQMQKRTELGRVLFVKMFPRLIDKADEFHRGPRDFSGRRTSPQYRRMYEFEQYCGNLTDQLEPDFFWEYVLGCFELIADNQTDNISNFARLINGCFFGARCFDNDSEVCGIKVIQAIMSFLSCREMLTKCYRDDIITIAGVAQKIVLNLIERMPTNDEERGILIDLREQCIAALSMACELYVPKRSQNYVAGLNHTTQLLSNFLSVPIGPNLEGIESERVSSWIFNVLRVISVHEWLVQFADGNHGDALTRASLLQFLSHAYVKANEFERTSLLTRADRAHLDRIDVFATGVEAAWIGLEQQQSFMYHTQVTRLIREAHSRNSAESSSEIENMIIERLLSGNNANTAKTFKKLYEVIRSDNGKPFNTIPLILFNI